MFSFSAPKSIIGRMTLDKSFTFLNHNWYIKSYIIDALKKPTHKEKIACVPNSQKLWLPLSPSLGVQKCTFLFYFEYIQLSQPTQSQRKDQYFMSSIDLNSKFKNHRAHEQALWSMLSLQQCMFALTGHLFTSGPVCLEHFSSGSSHCWLLLTCEASTSVSPGHPFETPPLSLTFALTQSHVCLLLNLCHCRIYFIQSFTCFFAWLRHWNVNSVRRGTWFAGRFTFVS